MRRAGARLLFLAIGIAGAWGIRADPAPEAERVRRLTSSGARNGQAFFSPRGDRISFVSDRSGSWQVWVMGADGSDPTQVTRQERPVGWPSWSADGGAIFYYAEVDDRYQLLRIEVAGGEPRPLLEPGPPSFRPLLSPDGRRLLFDRYAAAARPGEPSNHDLYVLELASGEITRLTDDPGYDSDARWSPDGSRIVFHSDRGAEQFQTQVFVMTVGDRAVNRLTSGPARNAYPAWSPSGSRIVYTSERDGNRDLWVMDSDGGGPRRLTYHPGFDGEPVWSPDGRRILFVTDRFGESRELAELAISD